MRLQLVVTARSADQKASEATMAKQRKKTQNTLVGKKTAVIPTVALKKGGGQLMSKKELKKTLLSLIVGVLSGYIVVLLTQSNNLPKTEPQPQPKLIYAQHEEPAYAGNQVLVTMWW
ncbi:hypothetical protein [Pseudomonas sp. NFPP28]|uniref:hypothetical protein n=1 Tax=Pseudomonas sp. NFPP28 TaxID=1566231 RepID=UPI00111454F5|nr:hypothetical protein [Pseudomonas sp. NFPP28]